MTPAGFPLNSQKIFLAFADDSDAKKLEYYSSQQTVDEVLIPFPEVVFDRGFTRRIRPFHDPK